MINSKQELIEQLHKNKGKICINKSMLNINNVSTYDDCDIRIIYMDLETIGTEDDLVEFCDEFGMIVLGIHLSDIECFEQVVEYNADGYII